MAEKNNIMIRFKLSEYLRPGSHKTAISLPDIVQQTNSFSTKNRPGCAPSLLKSVPKDLFLDYKVKCNLKDSDPQGHDVKVHFDVSQVVDETTAKDLDVAVSCSCPAFLYWGGQWNSHTRDALEGEPRPELTAPTERLDLREHFVICKHIKAVSERILPSVQHNIVKIIRQRSVEQNKKNQPFIEDSRKRQQQDEMRQRQLNKQRKLPTQRDVRNQLEQGLKNRDLDPQQKAPEVVSRDTPATPEEQVRVPVIAPEKVVPPTKPVPSPAGPTTPPPAAPVPPPATEQPPATPPPAPAPPPAKPATPPPPARSKLLAPKKDKKPQTDKNLMQRQLREEQKRRNQETNNRLRSQRWR